MPAAAKFSTKAAFNTGSGYVNLYIPCEKDRTVKIKKRS